MYFFNYIFLLYFYIYIFLYIFLYIYFSLFLMYSANRKKFFRFNFLIIVRRGMDLGWFAFEEILLFECLNFLNFHRTLILYIFFIYFLLFKYICIYIRFYIYIQPPAPFLHAV